MELKKVNERNAGLSILLYTAGFAMKVSKLCEIRSNIDINVITKNAMHVYRETKKVRAFSLRDIPSV